MMNAIVSMIVLLGWKLRLEASYIYRNPVFIFVIMKIIIMNTDKKYISALITRSISSVLQAINTISYFRSVYVKALQSQIM